MINSYGYTPPNSTSGWRNSDLTIRKSVNLCPRNHIHELFDSPTVNLTGKIEVPH